ncbi:hypothetical protein ACT2CV_00550 [Pasteurellaceae bacterium 22721_9_1]
MIKQFNIDDLIFDEPITAADGSLITSGSNWYPVYTQEDINGISASVTNDGDVWVENGVIHYSGDKPSKNHYWDKSSKSWKLLTASQQKALQNEQLEIEKTVLIQQTADKTDALKAKILIGYPQAEIDSFYRQEREARGWVEDNSYPTPMLTSLAENRGVPLALLCQKVIEKADQFAVVMGYIIGTRQAFEDRILAAKTEADLTVLEQEIEQWQLNLG